MIYKFAKIKFKQLDLTYRASSSWSRNRLSTKLDTAISRQHTLAKICVRSICNMKEQLIPLSKRIRWINSVNILSFFFLSPLIQNWTVATQNTLVSSFHKILFLLCFVTSVYAGFGNSTLRCWPWNTVLYFSHWMKKE